MSSPTPVPPPARVRTIGPFDRTVAVRVVVGVLLLLAGCVVATLLAAPGDAGSVPAFERAFLGSCSRSGADDDACRCALERWTAAVPEADRAGLDERLGTGESLPVEVRDALAAC